MGKLELLFYNAGLNIFYFKLIFGFVAAFLICYYSIPTIIRISRKKNLMDEPGIRSSHHRKIPNLGGIAIFYAVGICASVFAYELFDLYKFLFASLIILLYIGVMDDIVVMRAYKKLIAQILVSVLVVLGSDVRIRSLFGVFGIYELNYFFSVLFTVVTFIVLINAFNLIDGIDGLAGSYSVICSLIFGISYYRLGPYNYPLVVLCAVIIGAVSAFLFYNLSGDRRKKIFMGDTGSMILGFLLAFTAVCFIDIFIDKKVPLVPKYHLASAPVIAVAILILPIIDTLSVIVIRLWQRKSPLDPDKNHVHHKVLELGLSHRSSTLCIIAYYLFIIAVAYYFRHVNINLLLLIIISIGFAGTFIPAVVLRLRNQKN